MQLVENKKSKVLITMSLLVMMIFTMLGTTMLKPKASEEPKELDVIGQTTITLIDNFPLVLNVHSGANVFPNVVLKYDGDYLTVGHFRNNPKLSFTLNTDGQTYYVYYGTDANKTAYRGEVTLNSKSFDKSLSDNTRIGLFFGQQTTAKISVNLKQTTTNLEKIKDANKSLSEMIFEIARDACEYIITHPIILIPIIISIVFLGCLIAFKHIKGV